MKAHLTTLRRRDQDPARCEVYFRNMRALGFTFAVDRTAGTVQTLLDGQPADPIIEVETRRRAWWLLAQPEDALSGATAEELAILAPEMAKEAMP